MVSFINSVTSNLLRIWGALNLLCSSMLATIGLFFVPVGATLSDIGLLFCRSAAVSAGDISFSLSLSLYLTFVLPAASASSEDETIQEGLLYFGLVGLSHNFKI